MGPSPSLDDRQAVRSVLVIDKARRILDCFSAATPLLRGSAIRDLTGLPPTTCARILQSLVQAGFLERDGDHYRVGLQILTWTASARAGSDLIAAAEPFLHQLRDSTGETAGVYVRSGAVRTCVGIAESHRSIMYRGRVGQVLPLHAGAPGKVFMAYDPAALSDALRQGLARFTPSTICDPAALDEQLSEVRRLGYAFAQEERETELGSVAAPVYEKSGNLIAAISIGAPSFRLAKNVQSAVPEVVKMAGELSARLGFLGQ
jgi:IclR family acetate operon transcriptional repressor